MKQRLAEIDRVIARGPYSPDWASLSNFRPPEWYRDAKFGIFIHWGVYSVPAYDCEWYPRNMYMQGSKAFEHHVQTYGPHREFGYKDLVPLFRAEKFDPDAWAVEMDSTEEYYEQFGDKVPAALREELAKFRERIAAAKANA